MGSWIGSELYRYFPEKTFDKNFTELKSYIKKQLYFAGKFFFATGVEIFHPPILFLTKKGTKISK